MPEFSYKSFCWSLGTTSFRTKNFNRKIEVQLDLLDKFWDYHQSDNWTGNNKLQEQYYMFMKQNSFVDGDAPNKPKDAREKTAGLVDIGLIDAERRLTPVGRAVLEISRLGDFTTSDNFLRIAKDSYIYLLQLLKTGNLIDDKYVRPYVIVLYLLLNLNYLSKEEFTYLAPLCIDKETAEKVVNEIRLHRENNAEVDDSVINNIILDVLSQMGNYQSALKYLLSCTDVNVETMMTIGINRKSRQYDKVYFPVYQALYEVYMKRNFTMTRTLLNAIDKLNTTKTFWKKYLFRTTAKMALGKTPESCLTDDNEFCHVKTEKDFKRCFFSCMHLFKAKATLHDYADLNKRYINLSDTIIFEDNSVKLDIIPKHVFKPHIDQLSTVAFLESKDLKMHCNIEKIIQGMEYNEANLIKNISDEVGKSLSSINEVLNVVDEDKYERFKTLLDKKFNAETILTLLDCFKCRADEEIYEAVTDEADIPTIFEYILGIIWYEISNRQGKILDYMKLSLQANLLPKTHAAGGEADIVYKYDKQQGKYPEHDLLLEATLSEADNQRRMEMEPVSRHLGKYVLSGGNAYCIFVSNDLNPNVVADFRSRKDSYFYNAKDPTQYIKGMKIIPIDIEDIKEILMHKTKYSELYKIFEDAYNDRVNELPHIWLEKCIKENLRKGA